MSTRILTSCSAKKVTKSTHSDLEAFVTLVAGLSSGEAALEDAVTVVDRFQGRFKEYASAIDESSRTMSRA